MAKRYTDTELYDRESFIVLPPRLKVAWEILNKRCNFFGVWQISMTKLSFEVGETVTLDELTQNFKVTVFSEDRLYIDGFIAFQYGDEEGRLSSTNRFHLAIASKLRAYGLPDPSWKPIDTDTTPYRHPIDVVSIGCDEGQGKGKGKGKGNKDTRKRGVGKNLPALIELWNLHCGELPKVVATNKARNARISERLEEVPLEDWREIIQRIEKSDYCNNRAPTSKGWRADFDWLLQPEVHLKVREGKYDNRGSLPLLTDGSDADAKRVLEGITRFAAGKTEELKAFLGDELFDLARRVPGGISAIRQMPANEFTIKRLIGMLRDAKGAA